MFEYQVTVKASLKNTKKIRGIEDASLYLILLLKK